MLWKRPNAFMLKPGKYNWHWFSVRNKAMKEYIYYIVNIVLLKVQVYCSFKKCLGHTISLHLLRSHMFETVSKTLNNVASYVYRFFFIFLYFFNEVYKTYRYINCILFCFHNYRCTNQYIILSHAFFVFFIHSFFVPNKDCVNVLCMSAVLTRKQ